MRLCSINSSGGRYHNKRMTNVAILGSTGSIGRQSLDVIRRFPNEFNVVGLAGGKNIDLFREQVDEFKPEYCYTSTDILEGIADLKEVSLDADMVIVAIPGLVAMDAVRDALKKGKKVLLATKEIVVCAGELLSHELRDRQKVLPIDSEISAVWQCLSGENVEKVKRIILTASGGPFYTYDRKRLESVTPDEAVKHPRWNMGKKVSMDSATLVNKAMEVAEIHWLFGIPYWQIDVVIHPQSVVHSMVEFCDGSVKAQLAAPDMRVPIQYALFEGKRREASEYPCVFGSLGFHDLITGEFPCFDIFLKALKLGGTYPAALCSADEVAVNGFLSGELPFLGIERRLSETLAKHKPKQLRWETLEAPT